MTNNNEQEETEESQKEPEVTTPDKEKGNKSETTNLIDSADKAAERLENANKKTEELLNKQEALIAKQALGGFSEAGGKAPVKEEISDEDYANAAMDGTLDLD